MRPCFKFTAAASASQAATLSIFDEIGFWGVQAKDFIRELGAVEAKTINLEINSPGGDVFAGLAIYNALRSSGKEIVAKVMGVAASAASLIAMAGDKIVMPKNTFLMVHNPWSMAVGNAEDMRETADTLDKIGASLQGIYAARSGQTPEKVAELLSKDTWLTADEAMALGLATEVTDDLQAKALFDLERAELPANVKAVFLAAPKPNADPTQTVTGALALSVQTKAKAAGLTDAFASTIALAATDEADGDSRIQHAQEVVALAKIAGVDDQAGPAIVARTPLPDFRAALLKARAENDVHTDPTKPAETQPAPAAGLDPRSIYEKRNARKKGN